MKFPNLITIFIVIIVLLNSCMKDNLFKPCPYMYKLQPSVFSIGIDSETCSLLSSLQNISQLAAPVAIADIRAQLETGQVSTFTDAGFDQFLNKLYALDLDTTALVAAEITILNVIREYLDPPASLSCCNGIGLPATDADFDLSLNLRVGTSSFEYEVNLALNNSYSCDIFDIECDIIKIDPLSGTPIPPTIVLNKIGCVNGKQTFSKLWLDFTFDPTGDIYDFKFTFRDSTGATLALITETVTF